MDEDGEVGGGRRRRIRPGSRIEGRRPPLKELGRGGLSRGGLGFCNRIRRTGFIVIFAIRNNVVNWI